MTNAAFIAGDWGTSSFRLSLCDCAGAILANQQGPGIARLAESPAATFTALVAAWDRAHGVLPAILCGMVGSSLGWQTVPYRTCPVRCDELARSATPVENTDRPVLLLPGLSCRNPLGLPDVMRGEETQIAGALHLEPRLAKGRHLLCLPGTHSKWVLLVDGTILYFQTALTGELFDILCRHSVLTDGADPTHDAVGFEKGVMAAAAEPQGGLLHRLFAVRSLQLTGALEKSQAPAFLSGLVIGDDILSAQRLFATEKEIPVTLIGDPALTARYAQALAAFGATASVIDGEAAAVAGLTLAYQALASQTTFAHVS